jgi:hypothetical protein
MEMKESIRKIFFYSGRIWFLIRKLYSFAKTSRKINKLRKRQSKLIFEALRNRYDKGLRDEIAAIEARIVEESKKFTTK